MLLPVAAEPDLYKLSAELAVSQGAEKTFLNTSCLVVVHNSL